MRVRLDDVTCRGRAIDLREQQVSTVVASRAVRRATAVATRSESDPRRLRIDCAAPGTVHEHVGRIDRTTDLEFRTALARAARSRGATTSHDRELREVRERLDAIDVPGQETRAARAALASAGADERRLRELVAELRGRVETLRTVAPESRRLADAETELADAVADLSEAETDRIAAEQGLARAERAARHARDVQERRLRLQDRADNLRRAMRAELAEQVYPDFLAALSALPGESTSGTGDEGTNSLADYDETNCVADCDETTSIASRVESVPQNPPCVDRAAALAIVRIAEVDAPVVLADERFESVDAAAAWLDAPVVGATDLGVQTG